MIVGDPPAVGVKLTEQLEVEPLPLGVQVALAGVNEPAPDELKITLPVGVSGDPSEMSWTAAVQVVDVLAGRELVAQVTVVVVLRVSVNEAVAVR